MFFVVVLLHRTLVLNMIFTLIYEHISAKKPLRMCISTSLNEVRN